MISKRENPTVIVRKYLQQDSFFIEVRQRNISNHYVIILDLYYLSLTTIYLEVKADIQW